MRKVRYSIINKWYYGSLVDGDVYDVIRYIPSDIDPKHDKIEINDSNGTPRIYGIYALGTTFFKDVTTEYRESVINDILK